MLLDGLKGFQILVKTNPQNVTIRVSIDTIIPTCKLRLSIGCRGVGWGDSGGLGDSVDGESLKKLLVWLVILSRSLVILL